MLLLRIVNSVKPDSVYFIVAGIYILVIAYDIVNWLRYRNYDAQEVKTKRFRSTINFAILISGLTLMLFAIVFHINIFNYHSPKEYEKISSLTLKDFCGLKPPGYTLDGKSEFAFIVTSIDFEIKDDEIVIRSLFHPSRSYVYNDRLWDNFLLRHELYHFHITEAFARRIRHGIKELRSNPAKNEIMAVIENFKAEEMAMQRTYDKETDHSYVLSEQVRWENKIDSLLSSYDKYKNPTITTSK